MRKLIFLRLSSTTTSILDLALISPHLAPLCEINVESDTLGTITSQWLQQLSKYPG